MIPWTVAYQASLSMKFCCQEYQSGLPVPPLGDLPTSGIELKTPALQVDSLPCEPPGKPLTFLKDALNISENTKNVSENKDPN